MACEIPTANIHWFDGSSVDAYGDTLFGYYYEMLDSVGDAVSGLMGPYPSASEAEEACQSQYDDGA